MSRLRLLLCTMLALCLSCQERYPDTPQLEKGRQIMSGAAAAGTVRRIMEPPPELADHLRGGTSVFSDDFERESFGEKWRTSSATWVLSDGEVRNQNARNEGLWLLEAIPDGDVRIEFDVRSDPYTQRSAAGNSEEVFHGDLKCEAFNETPEHQTGYILIFGGWSNSSNRIARLEEHGDGPGARVTEGPQRRVEASHTYRMKVLRVGNTLAWYADDQYLAHMTDAELITGRYFGFNNWESRLTFDNVALYRLGDEPTEGGEAASEQSP